MREWGQRVLVVVLSAFLVMACGSEADDSATDGGTSGSGTTDNGTTDNGTTDGGTTDGGTTDGGTTDGGTPATETTINALQAGEASLNCIDDQINTIQQNIKLTNVVVMSPRYTAFKPDDESKDTLDGYFVAEAAGANNGIQLVVPQSLSVKLSMGDTVTVVGEYTEFYCLSQIKASAVTTGDAAEGYAAESVTAETLSGAGAEAYEGVLVSLSETEVTEVRQYDYLVTGGIAVAYKFSPDYQPIAGDKLTSLTGIVDYSYGEYKLQPRSDEDIVVGQKAEIPVTEKTISEIQNDESSTGCTGDAAGTPPTQLKVLTTGIVISPIADVSANLSGVFIGTDPSGPWSGLQVVFPKELAVSLNPGDTASFMGNIKEFYCQTEMMAEVVNVDEAGGTVPAPAVVTPADINTDGEQYEGSYVTLENLTVENIDHITDYQEVTLSNDFTVVLKDYQVAWAPKVGDVVTSISGAIKYSFAKYKLTVFSLDDIVSGQ